MSYQEQIVTEMADLPQNKLAVILNFVRDLRKGFDSRHKPLYSKEEQDRVELGYKMLTESIKNIDVSDVDFDKAKQEYLEGKYGRID
ncbi:MAG: hypothetical protein LBM59_07770 [Ruminococcus sp.]|jgi:hypothetical protein|nr:hypothetical protein [Ruminococcus sp.]